MTPVSLTSGKRVGSRRADSKPPVPTRKALLLALAVTLCVVAWGYLVLAAIDFGASARGGESGAWVFLGLSCLGATACLFAGLMLGARLLRILGIIADPSEPEPEPEPAPDSLAGLAPAATLTVSPVVDETPPARTPSARTPSARATPTSTTTELPAVPSTPPPVTSHASETLRPTAATASASSWTLAPRPDPLNDPLEGPIADLPRASQQRPWQSTASTASRTPTPAPAPASTPAPPAAPPSASTSASDSPSDTPEVPTPRQDNRPRGKRIAEKPLNPDGPRPTGGRRIAR